MNGKQVVVLLGIFLVVLMGLYPPWLYTIDSRQEGDVSIRAESPAGYHSVFNPPPLSSPEDSHHLAAVVRFWLPRVGSTRLNHLCLLVQWLGVVIVVGGLVLVLAEKRP